MSAIDLLFDRLEGRINLLRADLVKAEQAIVLLKNLVDAMPSHGLVAELLSVDGAVMAAMTAAVQYLATIDDI